MVLTFALLDWDGRDNPQIAQMGADYSSQALVTRASTTVNASPEKIVSTPAQGGLGVLHALLVLLSICVNSA
ncbi:MAG TPA: hypothetical protein VIS96_03580 [Terrimicrobiaceae bacterium]